MQILEGHSEADQIFILFIKIFNMTQFFIYLGTNHQIFKAK